MTSKEILSQLQSLGLESIKKVLLKHGISEPLYGVKVEELKKIQKKIKKYHELSLELFKSGVYDAMYLAGLIADETKITKAELQQWVKNAKSPGICVYIVPWVAAESRYGLELALEWIDSKSESIAGSGWATLSSLVAIKDDKELDIALIKSLLKRIEKEIHDAPNGVKSAMNGCVIAIGTYISALTEQAKIAGKKIGSVSIDVGDTACKVPFSVDYITKAETKGVIGRKKKMARC